MSNATLDEILADIERAKQRIMTTAPRRPRIHVGTRVYAAAVLCAKDDGVSIDVWFLLNWPYRAHRLAPYLESQEAPHVRT